MTEHLISDERGIAAQSGVQATPGPDASAPASFGARLALQRQRAGLNVTDIAANLRLHPNQVRAIEQEDLARLPAPAYVRGFVRSYARMLDIDPVPLLTDLNAKLAPVRESVVDGIATNYSAAHAAGRERMFPQWAIGIAVVVLIALGVIGWQATQQPAPVTPEVVAAPAAPPASAAAPATDATAAPAATAGTTASVAPADPVPAPADVAEPTVRSSVIATGVAPTLVLRFDGTSWAEVTDRGGKILLSQLNSAGTEHALDGELPLTVVIGDANFTSVEVRGAAFNLQPFTRNNVARFIIK